MLSNLNVDIFESLSLEIPNEKMNIYIYKNFLDESKKIDKDIIEYVENSKLENINEKGIYFFNIWFIVFLSYSNLSKKNV